MPFIRVTPYYHAHDVFLNVDNIVAVEEVSDVKQERTRILFTSTNTPFMYVTGSASSVMEKIVEIDQPSKILAAQNAAIRRNG